jgi:hypothetical protein
LLRFLVRKKGKMTEKPKGIIIVNPKSRFFGHLGYIKREHFGSVGAHIFVEQPDGSYKIEMVALCKNDFIECLPK